MNKFNKLFLILFSALPMVTPASGSDVWAEYKRACKITVGFEIPSIVAGWKDEGVSKSQALNSYNGYSDPERTEEEHASNLQKIDLIYGRYKDLSADDIYGILVNECVDQAINSGDLT